MRQKRKRFLLNVKLGTVIRFQLNWIVMPKSMTLRPIGNQWMYGYRSDLLIYKNKVSQRNAVQKIRHTKIHKTV